MLELGHVLSMRSEEANQCTYYVLQIHIKCILNKSSGTEYLFLSPGFHSDLLVRWITY